MEVVSIGAQMGGVSQGAQCVMGVMTVETIVMKQPAEAVSLKSIKNNIYVLAQQMVSLLLSFPAKHRQC